MDHLLGGPLLIVPSPEEGTLASNSHTALFCLLILSCAWLYTLIPVNINYSCVISTAIWSLGI